MGQVDFWRGLEWRSVDPLADVLAMVSATFDQRAYRFRNDDGSETTATWKAAQNTTIAQIIGQVFRLRIAIQETAGGAANNQTIVLQSNINGAGWFDVGTATSGVRLAMSPHFSNNVPTTQQMTGTSGTFRAGVLQSESNQSNISFVGSDHTELEWSNLLITGDVTAGQTVQFRVTINGALPATTTASPSLTAQDPPAQSVVTNLLAAPASVLSPALTQEQVVGAPALLSVGAGVHTPATQVGAATVVPHLLAAPAVAPLPGVAPGPVSFGADLLVTTTVVHVPSQFQTVTVALLTRPASVLTPADVMLAVDAAIVMPHIYV